jgi:hypothetical protein
MRIAMCDRLIIVTVLRKESDFEIKLHNEK